MKAHARRHLILNSYWLQGVQVISLPASFLVKSHSLPNNFATGEYTVHDHNMIKHRQHPALVLPVKRSTSFIEFYRPPLMALIRLLNFPIKIWLVSTSAENEKAATRYRKAEKLTGFPCFSRTLAEFMLANGVTMEASTGAANLFKGPEKVWARASSNSRANMFPW